MSALPAVLMYGSPNQEEDLVQVQYLFGSKDTFSPVVSEEMTMTLNNSFVIPDESEINIPNAILLITVSMQWSTDSFVPNFNVIVGDTFLDTQSVTNNVAKVHQQLSMARIPPEGFSSDQLVIATGGTVPPGAIVRVSANVMYNVNDSSLGFADGYTAQDNVELSTLNNNASDGAIFAANMQHTGGDVDALITTGGASDFTMQTPDAFVASLYYMTGFLLITPEVFEVEGGSIVLAPKLTEDFRAIVAVVLHGAPDE